ncbi:AAA family ATPase [Arenibacter latericius]|uniref:AAA family ATPase n=1 Tax=Arenibacter latericius TaxID=86104 RepID=UPI00041E1474|nr:AAA family ATPase [Arenibacter latericius]MDX1363489.1 AAA family ATPase [Arenibacter latericius]
MGIYDLMIKSKEIELPLDQIHFSQENKDILNQLLNEFKHFEALKQYDLPIDNKILLHGHTGCGKTATAKAIAKRLNKDIIILNLGGIVSSRLGETSKNVSNIFQKASRDKSVLFIDEFDFLGKLRDYDDKDSGEMKRLVNTVIQLIDYLSNDTLLIAATNHIEIIDKAILRRFQLRLKFELPSKKELDSYYDELLNRYPEQLRHIARKYDISYAEAQDIIHTEVKKLIIEREEQKEQN